MTLFTEIYIMIIGRAVIGIGVGVFSVAVPCYVNEIAPPKYAGLFGTIYHQLLIGSFNYSNAKVQSL